MERTINMKVGKERERINQMWKGGLIWKWERKEKEWIKYGKEDKYESGKGKGKNEWNVERFLNMKVIKEMEGMNQSWNGKETMHREGG